MTVEPLIHVTAETIEKISLIDFASIQICWVVDHQEHFRLSYLEKNPGECDQEIPRSHTNQLQCSEE